MTRLPLLLILCTLVACGADGKSGSDSATRTEPSATEPGISVSGYARVGVMRKF